MNRRIILSMLVIFLIIFSACGDSRETTRTAAPPEKTQVVKTPKDIGKAIAALYVEGIGRVADMTSEKEEIASLKPKLETYREELIKKLVKLGKKREAMKATDRAALDLQIRIGISAVPREIYNRFNEGYKYYAAKDRETGNLISGFNIITQYANFDLLKKQNPGEARRLDIQ